MKTSFKFTQTRITTTTVLIKLIWPCHDWKRKSPAYHRKYSGSISDQSN